LGHQPGDAAAIRGKKQSLTSERPGSAVSGSTTTTLGGPMRTRPMAGKRRWAAVVAVLPMVVAGLGTAPAKADPAAATAAAPAPAGLVVDETALVRVQLPNAAMLDQLVAAGADLATTARAEQLSTQRACAKRLFVPALDGWVGDPLRTLLLELPPFVKDGAESV